MKEASVDRRIFQPTLWYKAVGNIIDQFEGVENTVSSFDKHVWAVGNKRVSLFRSNEGILGIKVVAPARPGLPPLETVLHQPLGFDTSTIGGAGVLNDLREVLALV